MVGGLSALRDALEFVGSFFVCSERFKWFLVQRPVAEGAWGVFGCTGRCSLPGPQRCPWPPSPAEPDQSSSLLSNVAEVKTFVQGDQDQGGTFCVTVQELRRRRSWRLRCCTTSSRRCCSCTASASCTRTSPAAPWPPESHGWKVVSIAGRPDNFLRKIVFRTRGGAF